MIVPISQLGGIYMRIEQLIYFVETVETGSIGKASEKLYVSHQNISKALKQLEAELNLNLLKRSKNGVTLTPVGKPVYEYAKEALYSIEKIKNQARVPSYKQEVNLSIKDFLIILPFKIRKCKPIILVRRDSKTCHEYLKQELFTVKTK